MRAIDLELIEAVRAQDRDRVVAALDVGADVRVHDSRPLVGAENTPLHDAANASDLEILEALIDAGAEVDARCRAGWTPLMRACHQGWAEGARALLDSGASLHLENDDGYTAWGRTRADALELRALLEERGATGAREGRSRDG